MNSVSLHYVDLYRLAVKISLEELEGGFLALKIASRHNWTCPHEVYVVFYFVLTSLKACGHKHEKHAFS